MDALAGTDIEDQLREWLRGLLAEPQVALKDTRAYWVYEMFVRLADELGAELTSLTMLRHPTEVVRSRDTAYLGGQSQQFRRERETTNVAAWMNSVFETERVTRHHARACVRYPDLRADWRAAMLRAGKPARPDLQRRPDDATSTTRSTTSSTPRCSAPGSPGTTSRSGRRSYATWPTRSGTPSTPWSTAPTTRARSPSSSGCGRSTSSSTPSPPRCRRTSAPPRWSPSAARCGPSWTRSRRASTSSRTKLERPRTQDTPYPRPSWQPVFQRLVSRLRRR